MIAAIVKAAVSLIRGSSFRRAPRQHTRRSARRSGSVRRSRGITAVEHRGADRSANSFDLRRIRSLVNADCDLDALASHLLRDGGRVAARPTVVDRPELHLPSCGKVVTMIFCAMFGEAERAFASLAAISAYDERHFVPLLAVGGDRRRMMHRLNLLVNDTRSGGRSGTLYILCTTFALSAA